MGAADSAGSSSLPDLPCMWRPLVARIVALGVGGSLVFAGLGMWFLLPEDERALFSGFQAWTLLAFLVAMIVGVFALGRTHASADAGGVTIVNLFRTHRLEWAQILRVNMRRGDPWVYLDLDDGSTVGVMGIQAADGDRGRAAARQLRDLVAYQSRTERND